MEKRCFNCVHFSSDRDVELLFLYCSKGYFKDGTGGVVGIEETEFKDKSTTCKDWSPKQRCRS